MDTSTHSPLARDAAGPMPFVDPYRAYWIELRATAITQVRLLRRIAQEAPPEAASMHRELIRSLTETIRSVERGTGCRAWEGA